AEAGVGRVDRAEHHHVAEDLGPESELARQPPSGVDARLHALRPELLRGVAHEVEPLIDGEDVVMPGVRAAERLAVEASGPTNQMEPAPGRADLGSDVE